MKIKEFDDIFTRFKEFLTFLQLELSSYFFVQKKRILISSSIEESPVDVYSTQIKPLTLWK